MEELCCPLSDGYASKVEIMINMESGEPYVGEHLTILGALITASEFFGKSSEYVHLVSTSVPNQFTMVVTPRVNWQSEIDEFGEQFLISTRDTKTKIDLDSADARGDFTNQQIADMLNQKLVDAERIRFEYEFAQYRGESHDTLNVSKLVNGSWEHVRTIFSVNNDIPCNCRNLHERECQIEFSIDDRESMLRYLGTTELHEYLLSVAESITKPNRRELLSVLETMYKPSRKELLSVLLRGCRGRYFG